jgi:putative nucleotidyltransferase with HDIG domain
MSVSSRSQAASPSLTLGDAASFLDEARAHERAGRLPDAVRAYLACVRAADRTPNSRTLAEALRRLGGIRRRQHAFAEAVDLCSQSYDVALSAGIPGLAAEALNGTALAYMEQGELQRAREHFLRAREVGAGDRELHGRVELNLGIVSNIQGDLDAALAHYKAALSAFLAGDDKHHCGVAYTNLGIISADQQRWDDADRYFELSREIADAIGDVHMRGLSLLNHVEVDIARQRYEDARRRAEDALRIFDRLGSRGNKAYAYKFLGMIYRETGHASLAEARLRAAIELAADAGSVLHEAEASRELAILYQSLGRNQDALRLLNASHRLFGRLDARVDLIDVAAKTQQLEGVYLEVVRNWGQSIESSDSYTFGHSERVATYATTVARALGLDEAEQTTVRIGAYLHDLGKVRVPHEILNKPGRLTNDEFETMKMHPVFGLEMLAAVEFPWDIKPIIRWHHEKYDGTGYPDRLRGEEIPIAAQIICIVDVYDALTTTRSYRAAMTHDEALTEMRKSRHWWRDDVFEAFMTTVGEDIAVHEC